MKSLQHRNKELIRDTIDQIWHYGNLAVIDEAYHPTYVAWVPRAGFQDVRDFRRYVTETRIAFPDIRVYIEHQIAEGEFVATRYRIAGTHTGDFMGIPSSGRPIAVCGMAMHRIHDDRIMESWASWDVIGLLHEIGVVPELTDTESLL